MLCYIVFHLCCVLESCAIDQYYDVRSVDCKICPDSQWSNGGAIWSCYPCFGGAGSRSSGSCKRILPPQTATATISGETVTITDEKIPVPLVSTDNNNDDAVLSNHKIGIIIGTSVAGFVLLFIGASILYIVYRRQHIKHGNINGQVQPQPLETSTV